MTSAPSPLANARDVGGLPTTDGNTVRPGVLFRSDAPLAGDLTGGLSPWPPTTVIDLRSAAETPTAHPLTADGTRVHVIPLISDLDPEVLAADPGSLTLEVLYSGMLDACGPSFARIAALVAHSAGPTLLHCAVGKDRTGVAVAVLLDAVGADRDAIVEDYLLTAPNVDAVLERRFGALPDEDRERARERFARSTQALLDAPREAIEEVLDRLAAEPGGTAGWLQAHGLTAADLELLRERLVSQPR